MFSTFCMYYPTPDIMTRPLSIFPVLGASRDGGTFGAKKNTSEKKAPIKNIR